MAKSKSTLTVSQQHLANMATDERREMFIKLHDGMQFFIWSDDRKGFYRPLAQGYCEDTEAAGKWSLKDAWELTSHVGKEKGIVFVQAS